MFYATGWEHLTDELSRLDLKIHIRLLLQHGGDAAGQFDPFKGLVVSEEEVFRLIENQEQPHHNQEDVIRLNAELETLERNIRNKIEGSVRNGVFLPIEHLTRTFRLSPFEQQVLMIAIAVEFDRKYEKLFAYLQDDVTNKYPTADLAMKLICRSPEERRQAFSSLSEQGVLARFVLQKDEYGDKKTSLISRMLKPDERIVRYLASPDDTGSDLLGYGSFEPAVSGSLPLLVGLELQERICSFYRYGNGDPLSEDKRIVYFLWGNEGSGKRFHVRHFCETFGFPLIVADVRHMLALKPAFETFLLKVEREALLYGAVVVFNRFEVLLEEGVPKENLYFLTQYLAKSGLPVFLLSGQAWKPGDELLHVIYMESEVPVPSEMERRLIWSAFGAAYRTDETVHWETMAGKFQFTPGQIRASLDAAHRMAIWNHGDDTIGSPELHAACVIQGRHRLSDKAVRIKARYEWDDIVLPPEQKELLSNACNQMKLRHKVQGEWGFGRKLSYGKGLSMLFSGPPGTGKTMSAQIVASDLRLEMYKIDLSQIISKYIGETEKNLHEIFREARLSGAVLFFDEADALFGKRSEVKEANDKYANVETAYLLQKMEEYDGITIMATNLLQNIDEAFLRRINFVIRFPFPDEEYRTLLWKAAFPVEVPLGRDIDFGYLGKKLQIAGGNIKNIAMSAAYLAADQRDVVGMRHILKAAKHELQKSGRILKKEELGIYEDLMT